MTLSSEKTAEEISARASSSLRELGFGAHETAVILALNQLESATVADLGTAKKVIIDKENTIIREGAGEKQDLDARVKQIKAQIEETKKEYITYIDTLNEKIEAFKLEPQTELTAEVLAALT